MPVESVSFKRKVISSFLWMGTGSFAGQVLSWVATIFVMRLLSPSDYGLLAMCTSFLMIVTLMSELGINASIVRAREISHLQIQKIFGFGILMSLVGGMACYAAAPVLAEFYHESRLVPLIRMLSVNFVLSIFYMIPESIYIRSMNFRVKAMIDISAQIGASMTTLILALIGAGIWALILGLLASNIIKSIGYNVVCAAWVRPHFNYKGAGEFIKYGLLITGSRFFYYLYAISDSVIIGRFLGNHLLGVYAIALNVALLPSEKLLPIVNQVTFASYSRIQNDADRIMKNVLRATGTVAFACFPLFYGMASVAKEALPLILGAKWADSIVPFQMLCLILPMRMLTPILEQAVVAVGAARVNVINNALTLLVMVSAYVIGVQSGIQGVCVAWLLAYPVVFFITARRGLKALNIPARKYISTIYFPLVASALMLTALTVLEKTMIPIKPVISLSILISLGISIYFILTFLFKRDSLDILKFLQK